MTELRLNGPNEDQATVERIVRDLLRAAAGRDEYAQGAPAEMRIILQSEAGAFRMAAEIAQGDASALLSAIPSWRWNAEEEAFITGKEPT